MKFLSRLVILALIVGGAFVLWQKYRPASPSSQSDPTAAPAPVEPPHPDLAVRTWTNQSGRTFDGSLVSVKDGQAIIRRKADAVYFQVPVTALSTDDQSFVGRQVEFEKANGPKFVNSIPGLYTLSRKLDIKGYLSRIPSTSIVGGWRTDRVDPMFWFLLSTEIHGDDSGSLWVRVDEKTYRAHEESSLITKENLINFSDGKDGFSNSLPWSRPQLTLIEAQYGPNAQGINVTHKLLRIASSGRLPVEIQPELFDLLPHAPAAWELTVAWRTPTGEIRRTLRDGSVITWP
ncbi:MAG: SHD1 domain-containing protein [Rariglobus sp.]|nr:SHD1 domain-containing protein [Rariglobus sp.]